MRISHEAIYQALYIQGRGALRRELSACLRSGRALRSPRERARKRGKSFLGDALMISDRPAEIGDSAVPGHWEGDLILGLGSSAIGTLVERTTRFTMLLHLPRMERHGLEKPVKNCPALSRIGAKRAANSHRCWSENAKHVESTAEANDPTIRHKFRVSNVPNCSVTKHRPKPR